MKLYNFTANTYGPNWFVVADSRDKAIAACKSRIQKNYEDCLRALKQQAETGGYDLTPGQIRDRAEFPRRYDTDHLQNCIAANNGCSIAEIEPGVVIMSEVS